MRILVSSFVGASIGACIFFLTPSLTLSVLDSRDYITNLYSSAFNSVGKITTIDETNHVIIITPEGMNGLFGNSVSELKYVYDDATVFTVEKNISSAETITGVDVTPTSPASISPGSKVFITGDSFSPHELRAARVTIESV